MAHRDLTVGGYYSGHYSDSDYEELGHVFTSERVDAPLLLPLKEWLASVLKSQSDRYSVATSCMTQLDIEDMPLYINHGLKNCRVIAKWRLKIGK